MTDDIRDPELLMKQIEWEQTMVTRGIERFMSAQESARAGGRGDEALAERRMLSHYIRAVADGIAEFTGNNHGGPVTSERKMLAMLKPEQLALMTLKVLLSELHNPLFPLASAAHSVGVKVEEELTMQKFHSEHTAYFEEIMRRIESKQSYDHNYKRKSIVGSMRNQHGVVPDAWTPVQRYKIGQRLIHIATANCDLFEVHAVASQKRGGSFIRPTEACMEWIKEFDEAMSMMFPDRMPMLIPPDPWTSAEAGGYITPQLRKMTPLIIKSPIATAHSQKWLNLYNNSPMPLVYRGINAMQNTCWRINDSVLRTVVGVLNNNLSVGLPNSEPLTFPKCPLPPDANPKDFHPESDEAALFAEWKSEMRMIHEAESERKAKIVNVSRIVRMAREMEDKDFWFVYRADFRGRLYCATSGLSPQGTELAKALLQFKEGKQLGERGWYWFRVAGANRFGKDKIDFEDRVRWIDERMDEWLAVASNPLGTTGIWGNADDPYQFLAWCFEYSRAHNSGNPHGFRSHLPIGMDGSCNGLQHFSAMLRDEVGGAAVNLVPGTKPADIYQRVADVMTAKVRLLSTTSEFGLNWLRLFAHLQLPGAPRGLPKKPVMTLPYGSTERSCCDSVAAWVAENGKDFFPKATAFKHSMWLSPILWGSIGDVVIAAREAMTWIRKCASIVAKAGSPLLYRSPLGFPVKQQNEKTKSEVITTYLSGYLKVSIDLPTGQLDSVKMQNGSSPNFVHHVDVTHLLMTVNGMLDEGITSFAMIHDDYGTHAADIEAMHRILREQFVRLYTEHDLLMELHDQLERNCGVKLPLPPAHGTLNINDVVNSKYFFH